MKPTHSELMTIFCPPSWFDDFAAGKLHTNQLRLVSAWAAICLDLKYPTLENYEAIFDECVEKSKLVNEMWGELGVRNRKKFLTECNLQLDSSLNGCGFRLEFDPESKRYMIVSTRLDEIARYVQNML